MRTRTSDPEPESPPPCRPEGPAAPLWRDRFGKLHTSAVFDCWSEAAIRAMRLEPVQEQVSTEESAPGREAD